MELIVLFLFHLFLFYTFQIQGSSAVTDVFVKTGDDLILNRTEAEIPSNPRIWLWQFNDDTLVEFSLGSPPNVVNNRFGKVEATEKSYSVKLKDLQKSDNGIYTAKVVSPKEQILTQYNVTVQDPVSPADLTFTCAFISSSYNLTATCRADDSSISITLLRCENQTCNQEEAERRLVTKSGSSLHIYQLKESIVCNHSNQVSRNESIKQIENHCTNNEPRKHLWYITLILLVLLLPIIYILCRSRKESDKGNYDNTIYALPLANDQTETLKETDEDCSPTTTYSVVGPSMSKTATKTRAKDQPESVYSQIKAV
ncbi:SLAM family member 9-like isoform X2 [Gambusia affinis]|uniref:SLAM family member 9-like isoform X2 n=1 Tax=Gambusia affinis TaxID=33528 RepID=UPI001CDD75DC|nr:SLAM family member 9-like isoform X2 [Gambusia affinis]